MARVVYDIQERPDWRRIRQNLDEIWGVFVASTRIGDDFLTAPAQKSRKIDGSTRDAETTARPRQRASGDDGGVARARQRLTQEIDTGRPARVTDSEQAHQAIVALRAQIAASAGTAMRAHGRVDLDGLRAAMAPPPA